MSNHQLLKPRHIVAALLLAGSSAAIGQSLQGQAMAGKATPAAAARATTPLPPSQVDQLTAPVALYPDGLLAQTLLASKHPDDVMAAAAWSKGHPDLKGEAAIRAVAAKPWDPSVKSLVAFPLALQTLASDPRWMRQLGQTFTSHPADVMQSTQRLRKMARDAGSLQNSAQQQVIVTRQTIKIEPADPKIVYVPTYSPALVYGTWPYPNYPLIYTPAPAGYVATAGVAFGLGVALTAALWSDVNWNAGNLYVNYAQVNLGSANANVDINYSETHEYRETHEYSETREQHSESTTTTAETTQAGHQDDDRKDPAVDGKHSEAGSHDADAVHNQHGDEHDQKQDEAASLADPPREESHSAGSGHPEADHATRGSHDGKDHDSQAHEEASHEGAPPEASDAMEHADHAGDADGNGDDATWGGEDSGGGDDHGDTGGGDNGGGDGGGGDEGG